MISDWIIKEKKRAREKALPNSKKIQEFAKNRNAAKTKKSRKNPNFL